MSTQIPDGSTPAHPDPGSTPAPTIPAASANSAAQSAPPTGLELGKWLRQHTISLIAGCAVVLLPIFDYYQAPAMKGFLVVLEFTALAAWALYLFGPPRSGWGRLAALVQAREWGTVARGLRAAWRRELAHRTGRRQKEFASGFSSALAVIGALTVFAPAAGAPYAQLFSNLFTADPCSAASPRNRVWLDVTGTGLSLSTTVGILTPPQSGEHYWIVSYALDSTPQSYFAKYELTPAETAQWAHDHIPIALRSTVAPGSIRLLSVVCANDDASAQLNGFKDGKNGPSLPGDLRRALPGGVITISDIVPNTTKSTTP